MDWAMTEKDYSQRRACALVGIAPKTCRYASRRSDDADLRTVVSGNWWKFSNDVLRAW